jgi:hypothetical protein
MGQDIRERDQVIVAAEITYLLVQAASTSVRPKML